MERATWFIRIGSGMSQPRRRKGGLEMRRASGGILLSLVVVIAAAMTPAIASACRLCGRQPCGTCAAPCVSYQLVERTVCVPQTVM